MFPINKAPEPLGNLPTEKATYNIAYMNDNAYPIVNCPKCSHNSSLVGYKIEPSGQVFPSFHCIGADCNYNELIKLMDYK